jgi:hypothetical protein
MMRHRLHVIISFRDRHAHLLTLLPVLAEHLHAIPHRVIVVEQADDEPFNQGTVHNVGALLRPDCDYYCFHDVDLVPAWNPRRRSAYEYTRSIAHLAKYRLQDDGTRPIRYSPFCLGGVLLFNKLSFFAINGYSNEYHGWGHGDNDLYARAVLSGQRVTYRAYRYWALPHAAEYRCNHPNWEANCIRYDQMNRGEIDHLAEGLNTLSYTLVSQERFAECDWIRIRTSPGKA